MNHELVLTAEKFLLNKAGIGISSPPLPVSVACWLHPEIFTINLDQEDVMSQSPLFQDAFAATLFVLVADQHFSRADVPLYSHSSLPEFARRFQLSQTEVEKISVFWGVTQEKQIEHSRAIQALYPYLLPEKPQHYVEREPQLNVFLQGVLATLITKKSTLTSADFDYLICHQTAFIAADQLVDSMLRQAL